MSKGPKCRCHAYPYPHRWGGGKCVKWFAVEEVFDEGVECLSCSMRRTSREPHGEITRSCVLLDAWNAGENVSPEQCPGLSTIVNL